ncbi:MAG TPA: hypothetical protein VLR94_00720, partial [Acidobacteriota bacterium]|nr:hypothetical protein [Acidobacteriota bacterium]
LQELSFYVRSHLRADDIRELSYRWLDGGLELRGKARVTRTRIGAGCELVQNGLWDSGFNFRQYLFENRASSFLLPFAGEISSTVTINLEAGVSPALPSAMSLDFKPVRYTMNVVKTGAQVKVSESITIADLLVRPPAFKGFVDFLDQYYAGHFWSLVLTAPGASATGALP